MKRILFALMALCFANVAYAANQLEWGIDRTVLAYPVICTYLTSANCSPFATINPDGSIKSSGPFNITDYSEILSVPSPSIIDIHTVQPSNGIFANGNGTYFDYCSVTGCLNGPHLLGGLVTYMTTHKDASAQESALSVNFTSETGAAPNWIASHAYTLGQQIQAGPAENIYEVTVPGTSAATGTGPTFCPSSTYMYCFPGSGADASTGTDGTVTWKFIGAGINNGKSGVSVACHIKDGSGHFWCMNYSVVIDPQTSITPGFGFEMDTTNNSGHNYDVGGAIALPIFINGNNANRMTAAIGVFTGGDSVIKAFDDGIIFNGDNQIFHDTFADATSALDVFHCLGAPHTHTNCFFDESISDISVKVGGTKRVGVDTSGATLTSALAVNTAENTFYSFNNGLNLMGWNSAISALTYGPTNSGTAFSFASYDNGNFAFRGHLYSIGTTPTLSACGTTPTLSVGANDTHGTITEGATATGCTLTFATARTNPADCVVQAWNNSSAPVLILNVTTAAITFTNASSSNQKYTYSCMGK